MSNALPEAVRARLAAVVAAFGESAAVMRLGVSRHSLARALGGLGLYPGTETLIRQRLDAIEAEERRRREDA